MLVDSNETNSLSRNPVRRMLSHWGEEVWAQWDELRHVAAVIGTVIRVGVWPCSWTSTVRKAFARQVVSTGVEPLWFVGALAVFVGISVVMQLAFWIGEAGQSRMVGPLLVAVVAREIAPVLITLVVIVRSGSAMTTELGVLKISGEVQALEAKGNDPFSHLILPRVLGTAVSTFCLTMVFILVAFASGYLFAASTGRGGQDMLLFVDTVSSAVQPKDVYNILAKSVLPALFASASCCVAGLGVGDSFSEIPQVTQRALTRSIAGLFIIFAAVFFLTYL